MVRKLALVMAMTAAGLPNWAGALGLGNIDLNSYLNQPLEAEIPLRTTSQEELDSLHVGLASRSDFVRAGIDYQNSLRQLNFRIVREGQKPVIKITSDGDFREPYVSFLLEVNWSRGRIMREYTLLVDPPVIAGEGGAAVSAPQTRAQAPAPASSQGAVDVPQRRSVAAQPHGMPAASRTGDTYGPTQRSDTLWTIADQVRPDQGVSVEQTMMALQQLNPNAFIDGNVNQLKAGYVLKLPSREQIEAMTQAQARAEFRRQTEAWRSGQKPAAATATAEAAPAGAEAQGRLQLLPSDSGQGAAQGSAAQQSAEAGVSTGEAATGSAQGTAQGTSEQDAALRERVTQLQQQVQDLERLAQLKDDQLAALQSQLQALEQQTGQSAPAPEAAAAEATQAPTAEAPAEPVQPEAEAGAEAASGTEAQPGEEGAPAPTSDADMAKENRFGNPVEATRASPGQASNPYAVEGYDAVDLNSLPSEAQTPPAQQAGAETPAQPAAEQPMTIGEQVTGWWHKTVALFRDNPLYLGIAVAVLLVLVLAIAAARQRRRAAAGFGESILQPAPEPQPQTERSMAAAAVAGAAAAATAEEQEAPRSEEAESSYLSDFSISSMDSAIESEVSEADPLTEADVFLAYGRYQPAENMIKEAIENEPDRLDLKIKLLEIYYAARNGEAFEREAQVVHGLMEDHADPSWQKVVEMGRDLRPDSPLFDDSAAAPAEVEAGAREQDADLEDMAFDLQEDETVRPSADANTIDFDLGELEPAGASAAAVEAHAGEPMADEFSSLTGSLEEDTQQPDSPPAGEVADFDLGDLNLEPESGYDELSDLDTEPEDEAEVVDGGLLSDGDEVGTKLDLARAYIDMGDPDGARSILDEVLEEGSEDQKNEAQGLMAQIS